MRFERTAARVDRLPCYSETPPTVHPPDAANPPPQARPPLRARTARLRSDGCTEAIMLAHGEQMVELVRTRYRDPIVRPRWLARVLRGSHIPRWLRALALDRVVLKNWFRCVRPLAGAPILLSLIGRKIVAYEIDVLPVGDKKSGDAICVRYGNSQTGYRVILIDGGYSEESDKIIKHIKTYYGTDRIDHMILSHADNDHACGLIGVLQQLRVGALYMNRPWLYAPQILQHFHGNFTLPGLVTDIKSRHDYLVELEKIAAAKGTPVYPIFQGRQIGPITVLAPSEQRYISLLPDLSKTPTSYAAESAAVSALFGGVGAALKAAVGFIRETWTGETLSNNPEPTSASNETSVVQLMEYDGRRLLFTADVGPAGLSEAAHYAYGLGRLGNLAWVQLPHHGSRRNVTPQVLDWWLGPPLQDPNASRGVAYCSAAVNDKDHPRKKVENAFRRRGYPVRTTHGESKRHQFEMPRRDGWRRSEPSPFWNAVEE
jgi:beta-lactamase superfamily II metal-dependent hydrolase